MTYNPDNRLAARLRAVAKQVATVFIVDNGSSGATTGILRELAEVPCFHVTLNANNLGVATALNQGVRNARLAGFDWAVTLDQDSIACPAMVSSMFHTLGKFERPDNVALIGPRILHRRIPGLESVWLTPHRRFPGMFERIPCRGTDLESVTMIITSGALTNLALCETLGGFWDDLFIDYVDTEYCLRVRRAGYNILVSCSATLEHQLGDKHPVRVLGRTITPTHHSPTRIYYASRNRIPVLRRHGRFMPHWAAFDLVAMIYNLMRILLVEDDRLAKFQAFFAGTRDGLLNRLGPMKS